MDITKIQQAYKAMQPLNVMASDKVAPPAKPFSSWLTEALGSVNQLQQDKAQVLQKFVSGELNDVHTLQIASQKAELGLQLTVQVRNKVLDAYQEIMRMQV